MNEFWMVIVFFGVVGLLGAAITVLIDRKKKVNSGVERIATERRRQIQQEGWTPQHDAQHHNGEMLAAAVCYAFNAMGVKDVNLWPWDPEWDKREQHDDVRSLEIAGALIAAEIDRRLQKDQSGQ